MDMPEGMAVLVREAQSHQAVSGGIKRVSWWDRSCRPLRRWSDSPRTAWHVNRV